MGDRKCRHRTKAELKALKLPRRKSRVLKGKDLTRSWLADRCATCGRCADIIARLSEWRRSGDLM